MEAKPKLLVVDDDPFVLEMLAAQLEDEGYAVEAAEEGTAALDLFDRHPDIGLVLTDMNMPGMDGLQLVREIRLRNPVVPILLLTAHDDPAFAALARDSGARECLVKDEDLMEEIAGVVGRILESR